MACDHVGPGELMEMAEEELRRNGVAFERWRGTTYRFAENLDGSMWAAVITEIERRGDEWIVIRIDRLKEPLPDEETGLRAIVEPAGS